MDKETAFKEFKERCAAEGLLDSGISDDGDDLKSGIQDDATLLRFLRARSYDIPSALQQYKTTRKWRDENQIIELYESIDVSNYEETRKLYTHWTGRRDEHGNPLYLFEIGQLTPSTMAAYEKSCNSKPTASQSSRTESEATLRLFCTYENMTRFVMPLCSAVPSRASTKQPVTQCTCIVDISGVSLMQFWRLRTHLQAASALATSHYPETLGFTYVVGAPYFFPTIWAWINKCFDQNTVSKIRIVPSGQELEVLSETIDPANIPQKYGGQYPFSFGMLPDLDPEIKEMGRWLLGNDDKGAIQDMPMGPIRWIVGEDGGKTAKAVGTVDEAPRRVPVMTVSA